MKKAQALAVITFTLLYISASCSADVDGIYVATKSYNYGNVDIDKPVYFELEIQNLSIEPRRINEIKFYNTTNQEFWIDGANSLITVPGKGTRYLNVWFNPLFEGIRTAFVQVFTDSNTTYNLQLRGVGIGKPELKIVNTTIDFKTGYVGFEKKIPLKLENIGTGKLIINSIDIAGDNILDYYVENLFYPLELKPQFSYPDEYTLDIDISFKPVFIGNSSAVLILNIANQNDRYYVQLQGIAKEPAPALEISETALDYGKIDVGDKATKNFTIANTGVEELLINGIKITAINSNDFSISEVKKNTGKTISAPYISRLEGGQNLTVSVDFKPTLNGYTNMAEMEISHSLSADASKVDLTGDSGPSIVINECQTSDMPAGFGDWVELRNRGSATVDISGWMIECWQGSRLDIIYKFPQGSKLDGYQHLVADDLRTVGSNLPHFYIGSNLLWNRGGSYPGNYEVVLRDANGQGVDYICFGNAYVATPIHIPQNIMWNQSDYITLSPGMHYIFRTSDKNYFRSDEWSAAYGVGTPLAANPGQ